jgi:hypothetical protein
VMSYGQKNHAAVRSWDFRGSVAMALIVVS